MVSHVVVTAGLMVPMGLSRTVVDMNADVLQISASCVSLLVGWREGSLGLPSRPILCIAVRVSRLDLADTTSRVKWKDIESDYLRNRWPWTRQVALNGDPRQPLDGRRSGDDNGAVKLHRQPPILTRPQLMQMTKNHSSHIEVSSSSPPSPSSHSSSAPGWYSVIVGTGSDVPVLAQRVPPRQESTVVGSAISMVAVAGQLNRSVVGAVHPDSVITTSC